MKAAIRRLLGTDRERIIAVVAATHEEAERGVRHALTAKSPLPIHVWCAGNGTPPEGCAQYHPGATGGSVRSGLGRVWPALTIVMWGGGYRAAGLKLAPFTAPPFRVVIGNEADGYFPPGPVHLARHCGRRSGDRLIWIARRLQDESASLVYRLGERLGDIAMLLLSAIARLTPAAMRFLMKRLSGGKPSPRALAAAHDGSFTEIDLPVRLWPRRAIARAVATSSAEFIVLRSRGEKAAAEPLIEMAVRTNAFAVARQRAWSGWRARVATKHPFRKLQPGEVAEVFAPHGNLIVLRRTALAEFGVPRALTAGAALLLLYWRAAAADYASFVLGHDGASTDEPAMALEDAEFVLRLWLTPSLRSLAPAEPDRRRGNIAFSRPEPKPESIRPKVLIVSPYLPFPLSHGGAVRIYNLCRELAAEVDFHLLCFREAGETVHYDELHRIFRAVHIVDIDEKPGDPALPKLVAGYRSSAMAGLIRRFSPECNVVQLEYTQMALYRECAGTRPVILVEHDITFTLYRQSADAELWRTFETDALRRVDTVWAMSEADCALARGEGARHVHLVPNGVDLARFQPAVAESPSLTVLFVGSFRHFPNLLAFEALRSRIMPEVWKAIPGAKLHVIAGPAHEKAATLAKKRGLLAKDSRILMEGFVEDVRPAYRECAVVAVPVPVSAGTNIKVVEAMASGRAIVSNAVGAQGLDLKDGEDLLIREIGPDFSQSIIALLGDAELRERIAARARQTVEERFGWDAIAVEALACYRQLISAGEPRPDPRRSSSTSPG